MDNQIAFLVLLGAEENRTMAARKVGITSDMLAYPLNEKLWKQAGQPECLTQTIYRIVEQLSPDCLDPAVDGTLFPGDNGKYEDKLRHSIWQTCEQIKMEISFNGFSQEEASTISRNKALFAAKLEQAELELSHVTHDDDMRICVLTPEQVLKLALLSIEHEIFDYFPEQI